MLRTSQRRRLLRHASAIPLDAIAQLPEAERTLYLRMKERLEEKRRQGREWIGAEDTDALNKNQPIKFAGKSKHIYGGSSCNTDTMDAPFLESAVTEDLTLCTSCSTMTGGEKSTDSFMTKKDPATEFSSGASFEEYSCSTCSYACSFEQYDHHHQQFHQPSRIDHQQNQTDMSTIKSDESSSIIEGEDCGCLSASSSFKQEEMEIIFDSDLYRNMKSSRMLFATPFLREQHMKVLRSAGSLYDQAACSLQSYDQDTEFSYCGFFLEEIPNVQKNHHKSISSKHETSGSQPPPSRTSRENNGAISLNDQAAEYNQDGYFSYNGFFLEESPDVLNMKQHKSIESEDQASRNKNSVPVTKKTSAKGFKDKTPMLGSNGNDSDEGTFFTPWCQASNEQIKPFKPLEFYEDEPADDCSYRAFFLDEIVQLPPKRVIKYQFSDTDDFRCKLNNEANPTAMTESAVNSIVVTSCEEKKDINCSSFIHGKVDLQSPKPKSEKELCIGPTTADTLDKDNDCNEVAGNHKVSMTKSTENDLGDACHARQTSSKSISETEGVIFVVVVPVLDDDYDGDEESSTRDTSSVSCCRAADPIYIGEVDETVLDCSQSQHSQTITQGVQTARDTSNQDVKRSLAAFEALYASWLADRPCIRSPAASAENGKVDGPVYREHFDNLSTSDFSESDCAERISDNVPNPPTSTRTKLPALLSHTAIDFEIAASKSKKLGHVSVAGSNHEASDEQIMGLISCGSKDLHAKSIGHENNPSKKNAGKIARHFLFPDAELSVNFSHDTNETITTRFQVVIETSLSSISNTTEVSNMTRKMNDNGGKKVYETKWAISEDDYSLGNLRDSSIQRHRHELSQYQMQFKFR